MGNLDENGFLVGSVEEAAATLGVEPERVERAIFVMQQLEPVGVGARTVRECLLIQLDHLAQLGVEYPYARAIVDRHLEDLGKHKITSIANRLKTTPEQVAEAWDFIRTNLTPYPAYDADLRGPTGPAPDGLVPDVIIGRNDEGGYDVEVVESKRFVVRLDPAYARLFDMARSGATALSADERQHVLRYVARANMFIGNINHRRETMYRITRCLIDAQRDFLERGVRFLRPMTRAQVAGLVGVHESTVSRATAGRSVMLPNRQVVPLACSSRPAWA